MRNLKKSQKLFILLLSKRLNKKLILFFNQYSAIIIYIISYSVYFLSLEKCLDGEEICGNNMKWIYTKVFQIIISAEIIVFLLIRILFYKLFYT